MNNLLIEDYMKYILNEAETDPPEANPNEDMDDDFSGEDSFGGEDDFGGSEFGGESDTFSGGGATSSYDDQEDPSKLSKTKKRKIILLTQYEELLDLISSYILLIDEILPTLENDKYDKLDKIRKYMKDLKVKTEMIIFTNFIKEEIYILIKDFHIIKSLFYGYVKNIEKIIS